VSFLLIRGGSTRPTLDEAIRTVRPLTAYRELILTVRGRPYLHVDGAGDSSQRLFQRTVLLPHLQPTLTKMVRPADAHRDGRMPLCLPS
jgi:hypothetical protein